MKKYETPDMEEIYFGLTDIITTSITDPDDGSGDVEVQPLLPFSGNEWQKSPQEVCIILPGDIFIAPDTGGSIFRPDDNAWDERGQKRPLQQKNAAGGVITVYLPGIVGKKA